MVSLLFFKIRFEPVFFLFFGSFPKNAASRKITGAFPIWLRAVNNVRTIIQQQNEYIYIPDLREYANA
ncbi:MAG: hypothetical protein A3D59_01410 [Candidatus Wildermuthbacteria bacterium RIFCSPHIGHO2_02_FULL_47_17]|uniref:Uncharacterized protein n=1 Tax=Candidatus Wildermuthbacteria bacterium RIFCSPHIGHO2_02_FULL_47_17 TaxID=1802452 RepID=A0A1G2R3E7_9BACT|nr:MAG: hypothetical protein A3D59_01410 [Candidatus Wildermuthbacteria bacterium RIFCSPHIGHO2_02_FULL_47_17]